LLAPPTFGGARAAQPPAFYGQPSGRLDGLFHSHRTVFVPDTGSAPGGKGFWAIQFVWKAPTFSGGAGSGHIR